MASLLTNAEKTTINEAMDDLHDTFARDVQIIKEAKKTFWVGFLALMDS